MPKLPPRASHACPRNRQIRRVRRRRSITRLVYKSGSAPPNRDAPALDAISRNHLRRIFLSKKRLPTAQRVTHRGLFHYPRIVLGRWTSPMTRHVRRSTTPYLNNRTEQDHRGIKQRNYSMLGFGSFAAAARLCAAFDELRQYFRARQRRGQYVPLAEHRRLFVTRWRSMIAEMRVA